MRARYAAYCKNVPEYIVASTHPDCPIEAEFKQDDGSYGPGFLEEAGKFCERYSFKKLSILSGPAPVDGSDEAEVFFKVWYTIRNNPGEQNTMTEHSQFRKVDGRWLFYNRLD